MTLTAELKLPEKTMTLEVLTGTEGEKAIDIRRLRDESGYIAFDPGYANVGSCHSTITYIDGEKGILRYRGIPIEELAEKSSFLEVSYLLLHGRLPRQIEFQHFTSRIMENTMLHEDMRKLFDAFPHDAHPMTILASVVAGLAAFYHGDRGDPAQRFYKNCIRLLAKLPTIASYAYRKSVGYPFIYPREDVNYCENFLHMMFSRPSEGYKIAPEAARALDVLFLLHADHEQNCSSSTARMVRSSGANIFACVAAAIGALSGPLHGGANQAVLEMLDAIRADGGSVSKYVELAKKKDSGFRLMGFGHRVYKSYDPRCSIIKKYCDQLLSKMEISDPILDIAKELEQAALKDQYFIDKKLYPNVDFYSGMIYQALGIPASAFTVMFAIGRLPGWLSQLVEFNHDQEARLNRPRQIYSGSEKSSYVPMNERG